MRRVMRGDTCDHEGVSREVCFYASRVSDTCRTLCDDGCVSDGVAAVGKEEPLCRDGATCKASQMLGFVPRPARDSGGTFVDVRNRVAWRVPPSWHLGVGALSVVR